MTESWIRGGSRPPPNGSHRRGVQTVRPYRLTVTAALVTGFLSSAQPASAQPALPAPWERGASLRLLLPPRSQAHAWQSESPTPEAPASEPPGDGSSSPIGTLLLSGVPLKLGASITLRYEYTETSDLTDQFRGDASANGLRYRLRLGAEFGAQSAPLRGGIRISASQTPNPAVEFSPLGNAFRPQDIGFDQAWVTVRPFARRELLSFSFGKIPNPFWRGQVGTWRSEMVWDNDISPSGVALHVRPFDGPDFKLENVASYFQLNEIEDLRFIGKTGITSLIADQLTVTTRWVTAAVAFYDYENLNAGLSASRTPANAFLLRPGLFMTNNHINYGPGAEGFVTDAFRMVNATAQLHFPISAPSVGNPEVFLLADYIHNFEVPMDRDGIRVTAGVHMGDEQGRLQPLNLWMTYGSVDADAVLATFADSDLGAGSDYSGLQAGINYQLLRHLRAQFQFNHYDGSPLQENTVQRVFVDLLGDF
ncbi:hypothetical protein D7W79_38595 [Corallococcus exercitus]|nr:hypothetical protein D7W79_38595 [Corallococcus exercitus]